MAWSAEEEGTTKSFALPPLGYAYNALEPVIDAMTMEIHHSKHHQAYVDNLNKAVEGNLEKFGGSTLENLCVNASADVPAIRNNAGGHFNHTLFWNWIKPGGAKAPVGALLDAINASFGSVEEFQKKFGEAAKTRFGSGWAWLSVDKEHKLFISSTPNQDNPLMAGLVEKAGKPILGLDVWEHAYYLHYQNRRPDYISAFWSIVNWDVVAELYANAK
jgi:Fe-Mn family superoxide dismutase